MRIGIVSPEFPPDIGGVETYAYEFVKELASRGHEVIVFTVRHPSRTVRLPGVRIEPRLKLCRAADAATFGLFDVDIWHALNAAYAWVASDRPNGIVSVHGNDFLRPYYATAQPDLRRLPGSQYWSDAFAKRLRPTFLRLTARMVRRSLAHARHVVTNSRFTERVLLETVPECSGRTSVGFVGVGKEFFGVGRKPAEDRVPRLLTVSRLGEPRKNVDLVLRALALQKERYAFRYTVVGDGHDRPRLEALANELQLEDRVRFTGFVSREELLDIYAHADLMVLASSAIPGSHEGFGIVYLEAAASGVPSLAARVAGAAEAVDEGRSGMYVDEPTVAALVHALGKFLGGAATFDPEACRRFARQFMWANVVDHSLQYYRGSAPAT
jgi:phosphatidylinositol alpha-1,6-mannosyltransferase